MKPDKGKAGSFMRAGVEDRLRYCFGSIGEDLQVLSNNYVQLSELSRVCTLCTMKGLEGSSSNDACNQARKK
jgi:hypothetical protein